MNAIKKKSINYLVLGFFFLTLSSFGAINAFANDSTSHAEEIHAAHATTPAHSEEAPAHSSEHAEKEGVDAGKLIMEHIGDAHDWHMATIGHTHVTIPLPIIIKDAAGLHIFSSSKFHHGHDAYNGYKIEHGKIVAVNEDGSINESASFFDLSITKNVAAMLISVFVLIWIMLSVANSYKKGKGAAPKGFANLIEMGILFIRDEVAKPSIGPKYMKFMTYLLTIFFFIFLNNLFGLVPFFPGGANVTGNIAVTLVLALFTFVITSINGNKSYWGHIFMPPGVPKALWVLLVPIEIIGMLNKPIVLMIRLFANITAGHIIMLGFFSLIFIFGAMSEGLGLGVSVMSVAFTTFMNFLELLVAFLQAYVFTLLSALYFGSAVEEHAHHDEHH
jgi:F-type H+-transporting ATPase subunit a